METKKLTAKDLMIGDWVYRPDCYDKVVEIRKDTILGSDPLRGLIPITDLQPIPTTTAILKKIGFVNGAFGVYRLPNTDLAVEITAYGIMYLRYSACQICEIESVSHLQHLMRDLGINKEIVL